MKVEVKIISDKNKESTVIQTTALTDRIKQAVSLLEENIEIIGIKNGESYPIDSQKIYYIESIDNKTFIYIKNDCYESKFKLYELEELLPKDRFLRCSKGMILNIRKIKNIKSDLNARFVATLLNEEIVVISRSYAKELKSMLGL